MKKVISLTIVVIMVLALSVSAFAAPPGVAVVSNFTQLKAALEDSTSVYIVFASDIQMSNKPVTINPAKAGLVIDGAGNTLTGYASACLTDTIHLNKSGTLKNIVFQNMGIIGSNYYGIVSAVDSKVASDVNFVFSNVMFSGPALAWVRMSNVIINNSSIKIVPSKVCPAHEVAEALHVRLEGAVNILKDAPLSCEELFWITAAKGGVTIGSGANVNISNNQERSSVTCESGFVYYSCSGGYFRFEADSKFNYLGNNIFQQCCNLDTLYIGERADVTIALFGKLFCGYGAFHIGGSAIVDQGSSLKLMSINNLEPQPLLQLRGGSITFNNPKEVFIYNSSIYLTNTGLAMGPHLGSATITYNGVKHIQYWKLNIAPPTNLGAPYFDWANLDGSPFIASAKLTGNTVNSATTSGYFGLLPFSGATAGMNYVNVILINGAFEQNEAGIIREFYDFEDPYGAPLKVVAPLMVSRGAYNYPHDAIPGYEPAGLRPDSDPSAGTISLGETKKIVYLYRKLTKDIRVDVVWDDFNNMHSTRPASVGIQLFQNGGLSAYATAAVLSNVNTHTFTAPRYDASATPFVYTIDYVAPVNGYTAVITGNADSGYTVTFTLIRQFDIDVTVVWDDYSNLLGLRPATITVGLFRNGSPLQMQNVAAVSAPVNQQTVTFAGLPKYDAMGNIYTYTAVQQAIPGGNYMAPQISGFTITNKIFG
ncbi:MAG: Cna B-type domain-containing protein [Oscillospiraceae bacterium]|jgi:hypothetical protein|nr:Cna B-type domain-containing protein [Oscillospiraceae bacterium]